MRIIQSGHRANQMPVAWGCLAASGSFLKLRTRRGSRASSFGCKKSAEDVLRWNFDAGERRTVRTPLSASARRRVPRFERQDQLGIAHFAQSKKSACRPCLSIYVYWTVVGHQPIRLE